MVCWFTRGLIKAREDARRRIGDSYEIVYNGNRYTVPKNGSSVESILGYDLFRIPRPLTNVEKQNLSEYIQDLCSKPTEETKNIPGCPQDIHEIGLMLGLYRPSSGLEAKTE